MGIFVIKKENTLKECVSRVGRLEHVGQRVGMLQRGRSEGQRGAAAGAAWELGWVLGEGDV